MMTTKLLFILCVFFQTIICALEGVVELEYSIAYSASYEGPFTLSYNIQTSGGDVDIYLMTKDAFEAWTTGATASYISDASALSTSNAQLKNYAVKDDIEYTLAVYNPNFQTVTVTYSIDFQPTGGFIVARGFLIAVIVVGGVALLSSIGLILWCIKRRREYQRSFEYQKYYSTTSNA